MPIDLSLSSYKDDGEFTPGFPGMEVDTFANGIVNFVSESNAPIAFGVGVVRGTTDKTCALPAGTAADRFIGISMRHSVLAAALADGSPGYAGYAAVPILEHGRIWANPSANVVRGDPVFAAATTGALSNAGGSRIPGAEWETSTAAGDIGIIKINRVAA